MSRLETLGAVGTVLAGSMMWGLGWFGASIEVPRWILLAFLLLPVGDVQELVALGTDRAKDRLSKGDSNS